MNLMGQIKEICMEYKNCERCPFTIGKTKDVEFDCYFTYMLPSDWSFDWIEKQIHTPLIKRKSAMTEEKARQLTDCWFCNRAGCFMKYRYQRLWREASPGALSLCPRLAEALKAEEEQQA